MLASWSIPLIVLGLSTSEHLLAQTIAEPHVPEISNAGKEYLSKVARRTMRDALLGRADYEPAYVPSALKGVTGEPVVRVWEAGFLLSLGQAPIGSAVNATRDAALAAAAGLKKGGDGVAERLTNMVVEIELGGPSQPLPEGLDWSTPGLLDAHVEPGVHGLVVSSEGKSRRVAPSEIARSDMEFDDAMEDLAQGLLRVPTEASKAELRRFRTVHWYETRSGGEIVTLHRGMTLLDLSEVRAETLDAAVSRLADYLAYRQLPSGLFAYQFDASTDRYSEADNVVRQAGAAAAIAEFSGRTKRSAATASTDAAIRFHLQGLTKFPGSQDASFIATADGKNKLGVTALWSIALAEHPDSDHFGATRQELIRGILNLQHSSGMFVTAFPPAERVSAQEYFPGEALLALALEYRRHPSEELLGAFDRGISFYREYFRARRSPAFVPWQVQAFALMAEKTKRKDFADFVFELSDWLAEKQLTSANCPWPELHGGIASYRPGRVGASTASYLEAFADALALARVVGDRDRATRYEQIVRLASRFVLQLQLRPEEAVFLRSPRDAVGGIRAGAALTQLRIDHSAHALVGLVKARRVLFPDD